MREQEHGESRATGAPPAYSPLAGEWADKHREALAAAEYKARQAAQRDGKAWTLHADDQTKDILSCCPERDVKAATAAEYRKVYERLRASGLTPLEMAKTRAHYDKLRTACRFCMEQDVRAWRKASDRARKRGELASAQRRTERAFQLATVMDALFMQVGHPTWEDKPKHERQPSKSKRNTSAPAPDMAGMALLVRGSHGTKVGDRHAARLAVLALSGLRPAELKKGVLLSVVDGGSTLCMQVEGAKVNHERGQDRRQILVPLSGCAATALAQIVEAKGGKWGMKTTDADYRSLNRALQKSGLSCYSFRHQVGSELKVAVSSGAMSPEEAATVMGHQSTGSLRAYGSCSRSRGGRRLRARGSRKVRTVLVSYADRKVPRDARKAANGRLRAEPSPQVRPKAAPKAAPALKVRPQPRPKM